MFEAKARLSQLLDLVASGQEVVIAQTGKPIAKLILFQVKQKSRKSGCWKDKVKIARDFDATTEFIVRTFQN